jgi:flagellar motor switch protein FliG
MPSKKERDTAFGIDKRIAVMLLAIDQERAAAVLRHLNDDQLDLVTRAMKELQEIAVDRSMVSEVLVEAGRRMREGGLALGDVTSTMEQVLVKAFGSERGHDIGNRANHEILARRPFAMFESLGAEDLAALLTEEHPQIAAVFLAHLDREKAGKVLAVLPDDRRSDLVRRVATLDRTPPEVVQRVLDVMRKKVKDLGLTTLRSEPKAWVKTAAEILNNMGGGDKAILEAIGEDDEDIAGAIREEMFTFDDIAGLDKRSMQKVLGQIDTRVLALSLKAAPSSVENSILGNLSQRAADMVVEEKEALGPTPLGEVIEAQQQILLIVRDMIDKGEVIVATAGEQLV